MKFKQTIKNNRANITILIILIFLIVAFFLARNFFWSDTPDTVVIQHNDSIKEYPLSEDNDIAIMDILNNYHNLVIIKDGKVWMEKADCPDKLCMKQGKISKEGQSIVCLPHKIIVSLRKKGHSPEMDAVAK
ncbi:MAG: NusG domain II-containing protein [Lachnospiraceae bacterium]|nr:NusG domain II-containing protein [Lachnospiraceae bacterium]